MGTLLVTVAYGTRRRDLAVRSDVPIADLLRPLSEALAQKAQPGPDPGADPGGRLALAPLCGQPLPVERSLVACGIGHGAVLVLLWERG
jgi:hypothetical protein